MRFKKLAIASVIAIASTGSFAAYADVVFTDKFDGTFNSASAGSVHSNAGPLVAGVHNVEAFDFLSASSPAGSYGGPLTIPSAFPEPEAYAPMLAGLGVMGFIAMRRKAG